MARARQRFWRVAMLTLFVPALVLLTSGVSAHPEAFCESGLPNVNRWYALAQSGDPSNVPDVVTGVRAGIHEQNLVTEDYGNGGFVASILWAIIQEQPGATIWVETGYHAHNECLRKGWAVCFFRAWGDETRGSFLRDPVDVQPTFQQWYKHHFRMVHNSVTGAWDTWIAGVNTGGWSAQGDVDRFDIGTEITNSCSETNVNYFGDPNLDSENAFSYRVGVDGWWTTLGSANFHRSDPPQHAEWISYATYMRTWTE